jgi:hypothetical protein
MHAFPGIFLFVFTGLALSPWCSAFEQGSYHLIDLVESAEAAPAPGRVAVPLSVLIDQRDVQATAMDTALAAIPSISSRAGSSSFDNGFNDASFPLSFGASDHAGGFSDPMLLSGESTFGQTVPTPFPGIGAESEVTDFSPGVALPDTRRTVFGD